jgi:hypothetical protein
MLTPAEAIAQIREALTNLDGSKTGKGLTALDSLEAEVERLRADERSLIERLADANGRELRLKAENERLRAVVEAARQFECELSEYCDGDSRDALRAALAKLTEGELQNSSKVS